MKWIARLLWFCSLCAVASAEELPKLFLVGDSISIYYTPILEADLAGEANLSRKMSVAPESIPVQLGDPNVQGGNSRMVLEYLRGRFQDEGFHPEVVLVNCGLHDIKRVPKTNAIAIDAAEYQANLKAIEGLVRSHHAKLVWISTTPVDDARHNALSKEFFRYNADVVRYNEIAARLFKSTDVPIIDLYTFTAHFGNGHYIDHVHFDEPTRALQAAYIAGFLDSWLHTNR
jgi:lysophospholipase L1-like esterase